MVYTLRFFFYSKCSLFHNYNVFGSCIIHILYTGCAKIKKNNSGAEMLTCKATNISEDFEVRNLRCVGSVTKNFLCITRTVEHNYI